MKPLERLLVAHKRLVIKDSAVSDFAFFSCKQKSKVSNEGEFCQKPDEM